MKVCFPSRQLKPMLELTDGKKAAYAERTPSAVARWLLTCSRYAGLYRLARDSASSSVSVVRRSVPWAARGRAITADKRASVSLRIVRWIRVVARPRTNGRTHEFQEYRFGGTAVQPGGSS